MFRRNYAEITTADGRIQKWSSSMKIKALSIASVQAKIKGDKPEILGRFHHPIWVRA